jgi:hypothetical protein
LLQAKIKKPVVNLYNPKALFAKVFKQKICISLKVLEACFDIQKPENAQIKPANAQTLCNKSHMLTRQAATSLQKCRIAILA